MKKNSIVEILKKAVGIPTQDSGCCKPEIPSNLRPANEVSPAPQTNPTSSCCTPTKEA